MLVVSAPRSGEGKTTVALGIMAAFRNRGLRVQGFKVGPDYLDTGYQVLATGRFGRNLDIWMMGGEAVERAVSLNGDQVDIVVVEGAMGLFDGHRNGVAPSSTADIAALLGAPVVLVVDASRMGASIGALTLGFRTYDERVHVEGVILNRWAVRRDRKAASKAISRAGVKILGYLPGDTGAALPSRHLGLVLADEIAEEAERVIVELANLVELHLDLDGLLQLASEMAQPDRPSPEGGLKQSESGVSLADSSVQNRASARSGGREVRIAVALDSSFAFYYQDNLEALERAGAVLVPFSPLEVHALPRCDGLYLGGGYPELHAEALSRNVTLRESIRKAISGGLPTYAECGGLLYLCERLEDVKGRRVNLVGAVPGRVIMQTRLQAMGYREARLARDCLLGHAGDVLRGHEFHYSECVIDRARLAGSSPAYMINDRPEGFVRADLFASFIHLHFAGCPRAIEHWLKTCAAFSASRRTRSGRKEAHE
ncbi:MAG: cobyrinate a,c-diamide synthase [Thermoleophilia bacterium]|nr:cobyrinate a,c-diamide synthase [Thermoleophilia bacterium]